MVKRATPHWTNEPTATIHEYKGGRLHSHSPKMAFNFSTGDIPDANSFYRNPEHVWFVQESKENNL